MSLWGSAAGRRGATVASLLAGALTLTLALARPAATGAEANQADSLIYMPYGLVHSLHSTEALDEALDEADSCGIGQLIFATPKSPRRARQAAQAQQGNAAALEQPRGRL